MSLKVHNISFGYNRGEKVLRDISFEVELGKTTCIMGISGSGKSTLLRIIAGFLPENKNYDYSGDISFCDKKISSLRATGKLSFMFQEPSLLPNMNVKENISLPLRILNKYDEQHIDNLIDSVGLTDSKNKLPVVLSGGMKTRTSLARSFANFPELLLLDEPFSALDIGWKNNLYYELAQLRSEYNTTVIMVSHDIEEAVKLSDAIIVLGYNGEIILAIEIRQSNSKDMIKQVQDLIISEHKLHIIN